MTYTLYGRAGWGSTLVEAQLVWYGLPFKFEPLGDLFKSPGPAPSSRRSIRWPRCRPW